MGDQPVFRRLSHNQFSVLRHTDHTRCKIRAVCVRYQFRFSVSVDTTKRIGCSKINSYDCHLLFPSYYQYCLLNSYPVSLLFSRTILSHLRLFQKCKNPFPVSPQDSASGSVDFMLCPRYNDHSSRGQSPSGKFYHKPYLFRL